jgi:hypothetical protein
LIIESPCGKLYQGRTAGEGSAKAAFVGVERGTGAITTFHIKTVKEISKMAPSLGWSK